MENSADACVCRPRECCSRLEIVQPAQANTERRCESVAQPAHKPLGGELGIMNMHALSGAAKTTPRTSATSQTGTEAAATVVKELATRKALCQDISRCSHEPEDTQASSLLTNGANEADATVQGALTTNSDIATGVAPSENPEPGTKCPWCDWVGTSATLVLEHMIAGACGHESQAQVRARSRRQRESEDVHDFCGMDWGDLNGPLPSQYG